MAVNIKLKHSSVDGKAPVPADLENGELALNINENSPAAYIKNSNGDIVKLAGENSVSTNPDAVKKSETASQNMVGDLTLGTDKITLAAGTGAASYAGRVDVGTDARPVATNTAISAINNSSDPTLYLDNKGTGTVSIEATGGASFTGMITGQGPVIAHTANFDTFAKLQETGWLELKRNSDGLLFKGVLDDSTNIEMKSDGSATFKGQVNSGNLSTGLGSRLNETGTLEARVDINGPALTVYSGGTSASDINAQIEGDGSATFAGAAAKIETSGKVEVKRNDTDTTLANINPCFVVKNSATNADAVWLAANYVRIGGAVATNPNIELNTTGAATFAEGKFEIDDRGTVTRPGSGGDYYSLGTFNDSGATNGSLGGRLVLKTDESGSVDTETIVLNGQSGSATFAGDINCAAVQATQANETYRTFNGRFKEADGSFTDTAQVFADGSAEFGGQTFIVGDYVYNSTTTSGLALETGSLTTQRPLSTNAKDRAHAHRYGANITYELFNDGSTTFASTVTSANSFAIQLEADDDTKYDVTTEEYTETETYEVEIPVLRPEGVVGTADLVDEPQTRTVTKEREVTKTREVRTYNGAVLDVKSELQSLRSRATQQDETIKLMTTALKGLGVDVSAFPSPEDEEPTTKSRKKK
jgi:hypothetical protein